MARLSVTESKMILVNWAGRSVEQITAVDWLIIGVVLLSTLIGTMRGFVKEALSLVTLIAAIVIARLFGAQVADMLVDYISVPSLLFAAAYGALFVAAMMRGAALSCVSVCGARLSPHDGDGIALGVCNPHAVCHAAHGWGVDIAGAADTARPH